MNILKNFFYKIKKLLLFVGFLIFSKNLYKIYIHKWIFLNGNEKYLTNHKLNKDSIVFDVGGYTGVFSDKIINLYDPYMYIFEPIKKYYDILVNKYKFNNKIKIFNFGLSDKDGISYIKLLEDGSSIFKKNGEEEKIIIKDIVGFLFNNDLKEKKIDLISINIEGGEYQLLDKILNNCDNFNLIQVQFHDFIENSYNNRKYIVNLFKLKGYKLVYSFPFVWECFIKNNKS